MLNPRDQMEMDPDVVFLNNAANGILPKASYEYLRNVNHGHSRKGFASFNRKDMFSHWDEILVNLGKLIGGKKEGFALTHNTEMGLQFAADGLYKEYQSGKNIVITNIEFTTNSYLWQQICTRHNMELRVVNYNNGFNMEDFVRVIDSNTVLVSVSFVQFSNGYLIDLKTLAKICHESDAFLVCDAIQGVGNVPIDIIESDVDFVSAGGHKWQLGPLGSGFFYAKPELVENMESMLVGWFSSSDWMNMSHHKFNPWPDARRFQQNFDFRTPAYNESIKVLLNWKVENIHSHVLNLQDYLIDKLESLEYVAIESSLIRENRSGILRIQLLEGDPIKLYNHLVEKDIHISYRNDGIRVSPHYYNTRGDMDKLLEGMENWDLNS